MFRQPDHFHVMPGEDPITGFVTGLSYTYCYDEDCSKGVAPEYLKKLQEYPKVVHR